MQPNKAPELPINTNSLVQYMADNVDHNVRTLDGEGTFHGMGIIATITPGTNTQKIVPRIQVTAQDIAAVGRINIHYCKSQFADMAPLVYKYLEDMDIDDPTALLDVLWKISLPLRTPRPAWTGMMQMVHQGEHPGQSSVHFLPMIDIELQ